MNADSSEVLEQRGTAPYTFAHLYAALMGQGQGSKAEIDRAQSDALRRAFSSATLDSKLVTLETKDELRAYCKMAVVAALWSPPAAHASEIAAAGLTHAPTLRIRYEAGLSKLWGQLPAVAETFISHQSKNVHPAAPNNIRKFHRPMLASKGYLASGDVPGARDTSGSPARYLAARYVLAPRAWFGGVVVSLATMLADEDSMLTEVLRDLGAPEDVLAGVRGDLQQERVPSEIDQQLKQVYATIGEEDVLLVPVPAVAMSAYLCNIEAPEHRKIQRVARAVGGAKFVNVSGLACDRGGNLPLLESMPVPRARSEANRTRARIFYPRSLLRPTTEAAVSFLLRDTAAWPNQNRDAFLYPRIEQVLREIAAPFTALIALAASDDTVAVDIRAAQNKWHSPLLAFIESRDDKTVREKCATLLSRELENMFDVQLMPAHTQAIRYCAQVFVEDLV